MLSGKEKSQVNPCESCLTLCLLCLWPRTVLGRRGVTLPYFSPGSFPSAPKTVEHVSLKRWFVYSLHYILEETCVSPQGRNHITATFLFPLFPAFSYPLTFPNIAGNTEVCLTSPFLEAQPLFHSCSLISLWSSQILFALLICLLEIPFIYLRVSCLLHFHGNQRQAIESKSQFSHHGTWLFKAA